MGLPGIGMGLQMFPYNPLPLPRGRETKGRDVRDPHPPVQSADAQGQFDTVLAKRVYEENQTEALK